MVYDTIVLTFILLLVIVILATLAARMDIPYAVVLVVGGMILGFLPGLPHIVLDPDLVLLFFLPPLIYSSAWMTSWQSFRRFLFPILLQAIGLVLATVVVVAVVAHLLRPEMPWSVAFVLGAVVSPTDTVAADTIMENVGLSHQLSTVIGGEGLVNDATALVAYHFAVDSVSGGGFSFGNAVLQFLMVSIGGSLLGLIVAQPVAFLHRKINDTPSQITLMILTPFATYLLADVMGVSDVLATVVAGLYLGRKSASYFSANTRLQADSFWNVIVFLFNGFIFLLVGLQLRTLVEQTPNSSLFSLVGYGLVISLAVIVVRIVWSFAANGLYRLLHSRKARDRPASLRAITVVSWTGMRGGVSLATALALPATVANGEVFPDRTLIIFVTFVVILTTLIVQGLTLSPLIQALHLSKDPEVTKEEHIALTKATEAALQQIDVLAKENKTPEELVKHVRGYYEKKLSLIKEAAENFEEGKQQERLGTYKTFLLGIRQTEREVLIKLRDAGDLEDTMFHRLERDFDLEEERLEGR